MSEQDNCISDEFSEIDSLDDSLQKNLHLVIEINNQLIKTNDYLQKMNSELCKLVSNINNVSFVINNKIDQINKII